MCQNGLGLLLFYFIEYVIYEKLLTAYFSKRFECLFESRLLCLAQGHNTFTPVAIEPVTSRIGVGRSRAEPPCL